MMKALTTFIIFLVLNTTAFADHLMKLPPEKPCQPTNLELIYCYQIQQLIILKANNQFKLRSKKR